MALWSDTTTVCGGAARVVLDLTPAVACQLARGLFLLNAFLIYTTRVEQIGADTNHSFTSLITSALFYQLNM